MIFQERFMKLAIMEAEKSSERLPCGAVIVRDGKVVAKASNWQKSTTPDVTAHAEINAIREARRRLKTKDLSDCAMYCTCEPCPMCLIAIIFANIKTVIYAVPLKVAAKNYPKWLSLAKRNILAKIPLNIKLKGGLLKEEAMTRLYSR